MAITVEQIRDHYEGLSFGRFCYSDRRAAFYPLLDEFIERVSADDLLCDVGCGAGFFLDEFARRGVRREQLLGIDLAPSHVRDARDRGHRAIVGDILALGLPTNGVGQTFCAGVIHHTPDPSRALEELARITRPGGHIYLVVYNIWHPYFWLVHKATRPIRALHWRGWRIASRIAYRVWKAIVQPVCRLTLGRPLDEQTCRALFMDQVLTPYAHLFSRASLRREVERAGLDVVKTATALRSLMLVVLLEVRPT